MFISSTNPEGSGGQILLQSHSSPGICSHLIITHEAIILTRGHSGKRFSESIANGMKSAWTRSNIRKSNKSTSISDKNYNII